MTMALERRGLRGSERHRISVAMVVRRSRLVTGVIMLVFVLCHLTNHALGLISVDAMDAARDWLTASWGRSPLIELLWGSAIIHIGLALHTLYARRDLRRMPAIEVVQLTLGLLVPIVLFDHVIHTRIAFERYDVLVSYRWLLTVYWALDPLQGLTQALLLLAIWVHACIGLNHWLRLQPWYRNSAYALFTVALLVPLLSLLGFVVAGRSILLSAHDPTFIPDLMRATKVASGAAAADLQQLSLSFLIGYGALVGTALVGRGLRAAWERRGGAVRITYPDGRTVQIPRGASVLDASRAAGIAHASVCGGRGRCSTCRVRVGAGAELLPPPSDAERRVLERVGAPPNVRLACQLRPAGAVTVTPLLPPTASARDGFARARMHAGQELEIAVLFADIRGYTQFAENRLPYDVVFVLNRYFAVMGRAIERAGGRVDKFIGDGVMAVFGLDGNATHGARAAIAAANAMAQGLEELNHSLAGDLKEPLRIGIGIHCGPAIVGDMGYGHATQLTAIGDTVNTASRLESMTKEFGVQLIISEDTVARAGHGPHQHQTRSIAVRGRTTELRVLLVPHASALAAERPPA